MYFSVQFLKLGVLYLLDKDLTHSQLNLDLCNIFLSEWTGVIVLGRSFYLPRRRRPGTGDIATPPVCLSVCLSVRHV